MEVIIKTCKLLPFDIPKCNMYTTIYSQVEFLSSSFALSSVFDLQILSGSDYLQIFFMKAATRV